MTYLPMPSGLPTREREPGSRSPGVGGNAGMTTTSIPKIEIPRLPTTPSTYPGNVGSTVVQPPKTEISAAPDPRLLSVYDEYGRMRSDLENVRSGEQQRAIANIQDAGQRAAKLAEEGAFFRGGSVGGVGRVVGAKAQADALRAAQKTGTEMASAGMRESANMLAGQGGTAGQIASVQQGQENISLGAANAAQQAAALQASINQANLDREYAARAANQEMQLRLAQMLAGMYTG